MTEIWARKPMASAYLRESHGFSRTVMSTSALKATIEEVGS